MSTKHTPAQGSWFYDEDEEVVLGASGEVIGRFEPRSGTLAAAAPELLEALEEVYVIIRRNGLACSKKPSAAIAKAKGE